MLRHAEWVSEVVCSQNEKTLLMAPRDIRSAPGQELRNQTFDISPLPARPISPLPPSYWLLAADSGGMAMCPLQAVCPVEVQLLCSPHLVNDRVHGRVIVVWPPGPVDGSRR
jgi:hypothetical protein